MSILQNLGLSADAIATRKDYIGGSDANTIMSCNADRILALWRQKRGEAQPDDLSGVLAVQMGSFTEPLNIAWYEKQTGNTVSDNGTEACHPEHAMMRATLDGIVCDPLDPAARLVFEAKHTGDRDNERVIFERYLPQLTHNALCAGASGAVLSVFQGNGKWFVLEYDIDDDYAARLIDAELAFWDCVRTGNPPAPIPDNTPKPKPRGVVEYDMTGNNEWAALAGEYIETLMPAQRHDAAKKALKELVPDDASQCAGHGLAINRDKRGALRFTIEGGS